MHVRRALALSLVTPLLLAGCSDGGEPEADPTPKMPETSSPTPSPSETETVEEESPEEFIRRWVDVSNAMYLTGDTEEFEALGPDCTDCDRISDTVKRIYSAGGKVEWDGWTIVSLKAQGRPEAHTYRYVVDSAPTRYRDSADGPWKTLEGGRSIQFIALQPFGESWQVVESKELPE